jgi:DNA polymerase III alpha subunit (gram-positive type)
LDLQTKTFAALQSKLQSEIAQIQALQNKFNTRMQKSVQMIVKKVDSSHYMSRKRFIWTHWKQYVKREKLFIEQIKNVIQKSLWKDGFQSIKDHSREELKKSIQSQVLNKFRVKFWKRNCMNAFSTWRSGVFKTVFQEIEVTVQATN